MLKYNNMRLTYPGHNGYLSYEYSEPTIKMYFEDTQSRSMWSGYITLNYTESLSMPYIAFKIIANVPYVSSVIFESTPNSSDSTKFTRLRCRNSSYGACFGGVANNGSSMLQTMHLEAGVNTYSVDSWTYIRPTDSSITGTFKAVLEVATGKVYFYKDNVYHGYETNFTKNINDIKYLSFYGETSSPTVSYIGVAGFSTLDSASIW